MPVAQITVIPLGGPGSPSISSYVAELQRLLSEMPGIKFQLTPMATVIEGDLDSLFQVFRKMHELPFQKGALRVITSISIDDRKDKELTMEGKLESVRKKLQET
ncbi:MAG: MTH1187 family thiamine-binding protein [Thermanaeromonas sp.]|uniref:MTH1187 family thiamine-binding protein n=1 Tax=Thermanaeromonas sp. TaxID=2003697 RepID=UPI00243DF155|nr:MTH1187 family thiamine-binding protein [Thermanaeromonas sp.]MCG0277578.1 MTH1187 family thiamine-binding protein [Thermanaeromonas sp.]